MLARGGMRHKGECRAPRLTKKWQREMQIILRLRNRWPRFVHSHGESVATAPTHPDFEVAHLHVNVAPIVRGVWLEFVLAQRHVVVSHLEDRLRLTLWEGRDKRISSYQKKKKKKETCGISEWITVVEDERDVATIKRPPIKGRWALSRDRPQEADGHYQETAHKRQMGTIKRLPIRGRWALSRDCPQEADGHQRYHVLLQENRMVA
jgi:hypothetical protein